MRNLGRKHTIVLKLKGRTHAKKMETDMVELHHYITFLNYKMFATFKGMARFCFVTNSVTNMSFV
jgi:hypothetical protein